jgi:hypothetical protein
MFFGWGIQKHLWAWKNTPSAIRKAFHITKVASMWLPHTTQMD